CYCSARDSASETGREKEMRFLTIVFLLPMWSLAQSSGTGAKAGSQMSTGNCSPNIVNNGSGPVTVQLNGSCSSVDPRLVRELIQNVQKFVPQHPKTIERLNE